MLIGTLAVAAPEAAAQSGSCWNTGAGSSSCAFPCPNTDNVVNVAASVSSIFSQWRTIEGWAYCAYPAAAAYCAGQGSCQSPAGYGPYGSGVCIGKTGAGIDFSFACSANSGYVSNLFRSAVGDSRAESCHVVGSFQLCSAREPVCIVGVAEVACGIDVTEAILRELFPSI